MERDPVTGAIADEPGNGAPADAVDPLTEAQVEAAAAGEPEPEHEPEAPREPEPVAAETGAVAEPDTEAAGVVEPATDAGVAAKPRGAGEPESAA